MAALGDLLEDAARGLDSVASISVAASITAGALRNLPLPATVTFEDPMAHTRLLEDSDVDASLLDPKIEFYERTWDELCDLGLSAALLTDAPPIASLDEARAALAPLLRNARRIVAFTGAGVSVESGIPSYRGCGPDSLWANFSEEDASLPAFRRDPIVRSRYWQIKTFFYSIVLGAQPNAAHCALGQLAAQGRLHAVVTQNIDGLHERGGVPAVQVINLHGTEGRVQCDGCGDLSDRAQIHATLAASGSADLVPPVCGKCGGWLRPTTVMFGEALQEATLAAAKRAVDEADLLLVVRVLTSVLFRCVRCDTHVVIQHCTDTAHPPTPSLCYSVGLLRICTNTHASSPRWARRWWCSLPTRSLRAVWRVACPS